MTGARELFSLGDFSGSLELVEKVLQQNPTHEGARAYLKRNESTLLKMYESKLGRLGDVPRQLVPADEVIWLNMHHRAGFILSQVDGMLSYEDILDVSGMDRFDTIRILAELVANGIIGVK
jgi:CRP-like cAMP-binding protein